MAKIIKVDGTCIDIQPEDGKYLSLEQLQKAVGGYIEIVNVDDDKILIINEEGKLEDLPVNTMATSLYQQVHGPIDVIVGNVVFAMTSELEE